MIEWVIAGKEDLHMYSYGYTNNLLEKLEVLEGTLDIEKFLETEICRTPEYWHDRKSACTDAYP